MCMVRVMVTVTATGTQSTFIRVRVRVRVRNIFFKPLMTTGIELRVIMRSPV